MSTKRLRMFVFCQVSDSMYTFSSTIIQIDFVFASGAPITEADGGYLVSLSYSSLTAVEVI